MKSLQPGAAAASVALSLAIGQTAPIETALAQDAGDDGSGREVVVTAARIEQPVSEVIGSVSIITREDIRRRMVQSTQDLLRGEVGVNLVNNGGAGKFSSVFLRGADSEQVLVLVDGVRVGGVTSGTTAFEFLPVDQIERIEIVRGPRSSLYGADAIGGVIHIFTRRANGASVRLGGGSHDTYDASASFGAAGESSWFSVSGARVQTDGYNSCRGAPFPPGGGCFTHEPDADGYDNTSGSARAGYRWGERAEIEASALYASGRTEFDGDFTNESDFTQRVLTLHGQVRPTERWNLALIVGDARDDQKSFYDDPFSNEPVLDAGFFETQRRNASLQSDVQIAADQLLTFGVDYLDDRVDSTTTYDETSRNNVGVFAQYQAQFGAHHWLLSARHDDNEQFGDYQTGNIGWRWTLSDAFALTAAWGSAFGAPTFNDLYFPGFSNPNLDPEEAHSYEIGASGRVNSLRWSASAYETRVENQIVFDSRISAPNNLNEARIRGVELEANIALAAWSFGLGYSGIDPRNRTHGASYDNILPRRARHSGHLELARSFGPLDARVRVTAEGPRYDNLANTTRVGGYAVLDLVVDYALNEQWSLQGKVGNALDRDYQTVRLYNQDDRTFFASVRYQPRAD